MYDSERGWSLSFVGCGFLGFYHIGVTRCLCERAPHLIRHAHRFFGTSAGALHCAVFLSGTSLDQTLEMLMGLVRSARSRSLSILHPSFNLSKRLRDGLRRILPDNIHQLLSGKLCISLTRVSDGKNVLVSDFRSKEEVLDALLCSSFIPLVSGFIPPSFRGERYVDGGVSDNVPFFDSKTTITVSPFYGENDICPKVKSTNFLHVDVTKLNLRLCSENIYLISQALFPPDVKVLGEICLRGYLDAVRFLEENGICDRPHPGLNESLAEWDVLEPPWEPLSPDSSPGVAAWEARPEGDELLDHLRLSILPWDQHIRILSPKLMLALREAARNPDGYISKMCNFLPIKVVSYVMLPCTLPLESAIAVVQRLVMWLPDMPDDIQWLQWATSQICCRVMRCLLPTSRSQTPANGHQPPPTNQNTKGAASLPTPPWTRTPTPWTGQ
ncbi:1-acylglycerol-3-phosphate O-acyltransferase PNPLA3-like [Phacochoerus africanus]|uniref:1-acylglycerol-3-phosphate O-acyltransferase PNPLA3-like n=1 Tax=Phacochoerus africanus TaxID=41426 RepID=UPI001FD8E763|nr:1-acylglycerol-3-phosphate O-acyltransferase PNPLA3-like [Phacochoerus africanus]